MHRSLALVTLVALAVLVSACGPHNRFNPSPPYSTIELRAQLAAMEIPPGANPAVFERLRKALDAALAERGEKIAATAPGGDSNCVHDLTLNPAGAQKTLSWSYRNTGDYDQSGTVGVTDITPIAMHYGHAVGTDGIDSVIHPAPAGTVGVADITPIAMNYGVNCDHYSIQVADVRLGTYVEVGTVSASAGTGKEFGWMCFEYTFTPVVNKWYCVVPVDAQGNQGIPSDSICNAGGQPPTINNISPQTGGVNTTVFFTAIVTGTGPFTYDWQFGSAAAPATSTEASPQVTLAATAGVYGCSLTVTNESGEDSANFDLTIGEPPDIISVNPTGGASGDSVEFSAAVNGSPPYNYDWQFGGGAAPDSSLEIMPTVTLGAQGSYNASLAVTSDFGADLYDWTLEVSAEGYDEVENNDDSTQANALPAVPFNGYFASVGPGGYDGDTVDWFTFDALAGDKLRFVIDVTNPSPDIGITLYDSGLNPLATDIANGGTAAVCCTSPAGGTYFLEVATLGETSDYHISAEALSYSEDENNDDIFSADALPSLDFSGFTGNIGAFGKYDGDTADYFTFGPGDDFITGDEVHAAISLTPEVAEVKLQLLDSTGAVLTESDTPGAEAIGYTFTPADTPPYFIAITTGPTAMPCDYELTAMGSTQIVYDEVEDNDAPANANDLPNLPFWGFTGNCGEGGYDGDKMDYFNLPIGDLAIGDTLTADLMCDNAGADLQVVAYDITGSNVIATSTGDGSQERLVFTITSPIDFPFYLEVKPNSDNAQNSDYWLDVNNVLYDETESNDQKEDSDILPLLDVINISGSLDSHSPTPFDWIDNYIINPADTLNVGDTIIIHVDFMQTGVSAALYVWDSDFTHWFYEPDNDNDGMEEIVYTIEAGDTRPIYVDVRVESPDMATEYLLDVYRQ